LTHKILLHIFHHEAESYPVLKGKLNNMPVYLQIFLWFTAFIVFVVLAMYVGGSAVRQVCFKIITEMEDARAFSAVKALNLQDERKNIFRVGTGNIRPKALNILIADKIVIKTGSGKYYLDKNKLAQMKDQLKSDF